MSFPRVNILGSHISIIPSYEAAYRALLQYVRESSNPTYVTVNNVHTVIEGYWHEDYRHITNSGLMALPDGRPLSIVARWKGQDSIQRIFGPTFFEVVLEKGQMDGLKHFFLGGSPETLQKMVHTVRQRYPSATICGTISPPFRPFTEAENETYLQEINRSRPDIVWVALGAPKQERWMYANYQRLQRGVMIGIGAGFDYLAGNTKHAPSWMKQMALEWLYRLLQEPRRLWKRYLITNTLFVWLVLLEWLGLKRFD